MPGDPSHTDLFLLRQLSSGDQQAFEAIYLRYWLPLLNAAYKRLRDKQQSEDLVQNVFLRLWNKRDSLQVDDLAAYLHTAVRYEVLNFVKRNKVSTEFYRYLEDVIMETETPDARILTDELMDLIYAYADTLPAKRRRIFLLHIQNKLSTKQIAETLAVSQKTVQNQLLTALNGLRTRIIPVAMVIVAKLFITGRG